MPKKATKPTKSMKAAKAAAKFPDGVVFRKNRQVLAHKNPDGSVDLLRKDEKKYFLTIFGIALEVWSMFDGKTSLGKVRDRLRRKYNPTERQLERDLTRFLRQLLEEGLVASASSRSRGRK